MSCGRDKPQCIYPPVDGVSVGVGRCECQSCERLRAGSAGRLTLLLSGTRLGVGLLGQTVYSHSLCVWEFSVSEDSTSCRVKIFEKNSEQFHRGKFEFATYQQLFIQRFHCIYNRVYFVWGVLSKIEAN